MPIHEKTYCYCAYYRCTTHPTSYYTRYDITAEEEAGIFPAASDCPSRCQYLIVVITPRVFRHRYDTTSAWPSIPSCQYLGIDTASVLGRRCHATGNLPLILRHQRSTVDITHPVFGRCYHATSTWRQYHPTSIWPSVTKHTSIWPSN